MRTRPSKNSTRSSTKTDPSSLGVALYIHIPFCASKCRYCDFNSYPLQQKPTQPYLDALLVELEARAPKRPETIFVGGGTPSILPAEQISWFLDELDRVTDFRDSTREISFECNPESVTLEKTRALRDGGVNRLSIGVQSFQPELLKFYDRAHDANQARGAFAAAREAGFDNINLDLIFCAPGQSLDGWKQDLEEALRLEPDHVAAYDLIYEEGTTLLKWKNAGKLDAQDEEAQASMYRYTMDHMKARGFDRYEISNYAKPRKQCLHNLNYWKNGEYVGVGAGAVSYFGGKRQKNLSGIEPYMQAILKKTNPFEEEESLDPRARLGETLMLRFRLAQGISRKQIQEETGFDIAQVYANKIEELRDAALLTFDGEELRLTERGLFLGDFVAAQFL